jgi:hypothetical protein
LGPGIELVAAGAAPLSATARAGHRSVSERLSPAGAETGFETEIGSTTPA